ncbi:MAG: ABC transporter substrate-binding protein [Winogradskyella sp.]
MKPLRIIIFLFLLLACKNKNTPNRTLPSLDQKALVLNYAKGFSVKDYTTHKIISITNPWPDSDKTFNYLLTSRDTANDIDYDATQIDGVITDNIKKLVVTSTTHIPALELLGVEHTLVGFPGTDYISSEKTRKRISSGKVRELGKNEGINTEVLLSLQPDIVVGFGVDGVNKTFETIKKSGIPVIYNGDWVESTALAKAEWIKFFGVLFNKEKEADSIFKDIENNYNEAKQIASQAKSSPTVLSGAMHKDVWYLPNGTSPEAQFLKDANVNYLWSETTGKGSLALNFETVFEKGQDAELWINPSYYGSLEQIENANALYKNFEAFRSKKVYSFANTKGETGGVLYYELGTTRPDLVLKDIIKICHPELLQDYQPFFFKALK